MDTADASVTVVQLPPAFVGEQAVYGPHYRGGLAPPPEWWANFAHPLAPWPPGPLQCTPAMHQQCCWPPPPPPPPPPLPLQQFTPQPPMQGQFCWPPPPQQFFVMNCFAVSPGLSYQPVPWQPPISPQFQIPCFQAPPAPAPVPAFINPAPPPAPVPAYMNPPPPPADAPKLPGPILNSPAMAPPKPPRPSWADISEELPASASHPQESQEGASSSSAPQSLPHLLGNRPKASKSKKGRKRT